MPARPRPRVTVISTGDELVEPGQPLVPGQIWESNSVMLAAAARQAGCAVTRYPVVRDDTDAVLAAVQDALASADLLVTSGGVSMGAEHDVVKAALSKLGTVRFRQVAMQPGMPQGFGLVGGGTSRSSPCRATRSAPTCRSSCSSRPPWTRSRTLHPKRMRSPRGHSHRRRLVPRGQEVVPARHPRPAGRRGGPGHPGVRADVAPAGVAGPGQRADRRARGGDRRWTPGDGRRAYWSCPVIEPRSAWPGGGLTHLDAAGHARMVDVSGKDVTARTATATGRVLLSPVAVAALRDGTLPKGDALAVARIAGIQGAKRTPDLIPLCHPIGLHAVAVDLDVGDDGVRDHGGDPDRGPDRRGDGGADRGGRRRAGADRHDQGRRPGRRHHRHPGRGEDRRQDRRLAAAGV